MERNCEETKNRSIHTENIHIVGKPGTKMVKCKGLIKLTSKAKAHKYTKGGSRGVRNIDNPAKGR